MIVAIKALTRAFSAVARSANTHPRVVMLALVAIAVSIIVIAVARRLFAVDTAEHAEDLLRCSGRCAAWVTGAAPPSQSRLLVFDRLSCCRIIEPTHERG